MYVSETDFYSNHLFKSNFNTKKDFQGRDTTVTIFEDYFTIKDNLNEATTKIPFTDQLRLKFLLNDKAVIDKTSGQMKNCIGFQIIKTDDDDQRLENNQSQNSLIQQDLLNQSQAQHKSHGYDQFSNFSQTTNHLFPSNVSLMNFVNKEFQFNADHTNSNLSGYDHVAQLYSNSKSDMEQVYKYFRSKIIMMNFHRQYRAIKRIGRGTFASVYLVSNRDTKKQYAVKHFSKNALYKDKDGLKSFFNELNLMKQVNHSHAIKLYEVWETNNSYYCALDYIKNGSLLDKILMHRRVITKTNCRKDTIMRNSEIKEYMKQIISVLIEIKKKKILHRDIKPENILLRSKKSADCVISDFGLAQKIIPGVPYMFPKCGTPGYVAPEIINLQSENSEEAKYNEKCDVFSAGCIFYFMNVLEPPFGAKSARHVIKNNKKGFINFQHSRFLSLNKNTQDLIKQMLEIDPQNRISAEESLNHQYFAYDEFEDDDESIPCDSPVDINNKKNRIINYFHYNVFNLNSVGMKNQKQDMVGKMMDSFKIPKIQQKQTSLVLRNQGQNTLANKEQQNYHEQPSIEEFLEDQSNVNQEDEEYDEMEALFPKTSQEIIKNNTDQQQNLKNKTCVSMKDQENSFDHDNINEEQKKPENIYHTKKNQFIVNHVHNPNTIQKNSNNNNKTTSQIARNGKQKVDDTLLQLIPETKQ